MLTSALGVKPYFVTFTGVDDHTDLSRMVDLSTRYSIEWGVLIGGRPGKTRYPSPERINELSELSRAHSEIYLALHLCGVHASNAQQHAMAPEGIDMGGYPRVQVNALTYDLDRLGRFSDRMKKEVIYQFRGDEFPDDLPMGVFALHDLSRGEGKVPDSRPEWTELSPMVGYAGGFSPDNIGEQLPLIRARNYWIDMETGVRTDDRFDLDRCEAVCKAIWG